MRVLYVDMALALGGSVISLYRLIRGLDGTPVEPIVCLYHANAAIAGYRTLGVETLILNAADRPAPSATPARRPPRHSPWRRRLGALRRALTIMLPRAQQLHRLIQAKGANLVHTNNALVENWDAILAARLAGVPCIAHVRRFQQVGPFERWLARGLAGIIYISQAVAANHREQGIHSQRDRVIYDGLPPESFTPVTEEVRQQVRHEFGIAQDAPLIGVVGRLTPWKGQDVFLRAFAQIHTRMPDARALIIGGGGPGDEAFVAELSRWQEALGLGQSVIFTGERSDVPRLLRGLDLLVHSSTEPEPFGLVIIEGMAAGLPVVATRGGGAVEAVRVRETGLLVPRGDGTAMAQAVLSLLSDGEQMRAMGEAARWWAEEQFTLKRFARDVHQLYQEVGQSERQG